MDGRRSLNIIICILLNLLLSQRSRSAEKDVFQLPKLVAVQNRKFNVNKDLTLQLGYLPLDAFNKSLVFGVNYTHYFNDYFGWEIANGFYAINSETSLRGQLASVGLSVEDENRIFKDFINWSLTSHIVYTPLYTKSLLFNDSIMRGETSFLIGGGLAKFDFSGISPQAGLGIVMRFFLSPRTSFKADVRSYFAFKETGFATILSIILGVSWQIGDAPKGEAL